MNFFRDGKELEEYYEENELDESSTLALSLDEAFQVGKRAFSVEKSIKEYKEELKK